jgi:hypothetical protein
MGFNGKGTGKNGKGTGKKIASGQFGKIRIAADLGCGLLFYSTYGI